jgi:polyhydroxybutyrate depolymerase
MVALLLFVVACRRHDRVELGDEARFAEQALGTTALVLLPSWPARPLFVHLPKNAAGVRPAPLLLVFHGGGHNADKMVRLSCPNGDINSPKCLHVTAERSGFITAYLNGTPNPHLPTIRTWNGGGGAPGFSCVSNLACETRVDDIAYVNAAIDAVIARVNVDPQRIYATGISNGAALAHRVACEMSGRIAAVAAVAGSNQFSTSAPCAPTRGVSVLQIHGTADPMWPFKGGEMPQNPGKGLGAEDSARDWARRNRCNLTPVVRELEDVDPQDGTRARRESFQGCGAGDVELVVIEGGGHTWPSGYQYKPVAEVGRTSRDVDANEMIVDFFRAH